MSAPNPRNPVRVGVVTTSFPVAGNTSAGIFVERLVAHLPETVMATVLMPASDSVVTPPANASYQINCFAYGPRTWQRLALRPGGIPDALGRLDPAVLLLPLLMPAMFVACLRLAGQVEVMHGNWSVPGLVAAVAARVRGRPSIVTLRGEDVTRAENSKLFEWLLRACLRLNNYAVVVSEAMCERLSRRFPQHVHRIRLIPNGVSISGASTYPKLRSPLRVVTVSSLIQRKRVETLIEALGHLRKQVDVTLRIVGDGPQRTALEKQATDLGVRKYVEFVGLVQPESVEQHLEWADIFVFASESEGRPNAVLEAMAASLPFIGADIPGVRELAAGDTGLLYPVGNAQALAQHIRQLAANPEDAWRMGKRGRQRILDDDLSWESAGKRYAALYKEISCAE